MLPVSIMQRIFEWNYEAINGLYFRSGFQQKQTGCLVIPLEITGLTVTNVNGEECRKMVLEGICTAGQYLLISAYCSDKSHNSVIYVVKLSTMKFTCTIKLDTMAHVGGIAYDPVSKNLWVCNSDKNSLYVYNLSDLPSKAINASSNVNQSFYMYHIASSDVSVTPSFCTYYIWNDLGGKF